MSLLFQGTKDIPSHFCSHFESMIFYTKCRDTEICEFPWRVMFHDAGNLTSTSTSGVLFQLPIHLHRWQKIPTTWGDQAISLVVGCTPKGPTVGVPWWEISKKKNCIKWVFMGYFIPKNPERTPAKYHGYTYVRGTPVLVPWFLAAKKSPIASLSSTTQLI